MLLDKLVSVSFIAPWDSAASRLAGRAHAERRSREAISLPKRESTTGGSGGIRTLEPFDRLRAFQARALDHYATLPRRNLLRAFGPD